MQRYNLVYRPRDADLAKRFADYAQNFAAISADYLIDNLGALPHVTLCQFEAESGELAQIWRKAGVALPNLMALSFDQLYVADYDDGYLWIGFSVKRNLALVQFQKIAASFAYAIGDRPILTGSDEAFFPHLTLARTTRDRAIAAPVLDRFRWPENFFGQEYPFYLSLGVSDENGVFLREIYPDAAQ